MVVGDKSLLDLTAKQREVMDLLIEHKTSKEIARALGISPHTVDQRINFAKSKLGAASRGEAAVEYRRLVELLCEQSVYEGSHMVAEADSPDAAPANDVAHRLTVTHPERRHSDKGDETEVDYRVVPEMFEGRHGTLLRLGAIAVFTVLLIFVTLGGLAMFSELSQLFAA
jgi:DNA-binding CsgD family transcriptional regulator